MIFFFSISKMETNSPKKSRPRRTVILNGRYIGGRVTPMFSHASFNDSPASVHLAKSRCCMGVRPNFAAPIASFRRVYALSPSSGSCSCGCLFVAPLCLLRKKRWSTFLFFHVPLRLFLRDLIRRPRIRLLTKVFAIIYTITFYLINFFNTCNLINSWVFSTLPSV